MKIHYTLKGTRLFKGSQDVVANGLKTGFKPSTEVYFLISPDGFYYETKVEKELDVVRTMLMTILCGFAGITTNEKIGHIQKNTLPRFQDETFSAHPSSIHRRQLAEIFDLAPIPEEISIEEENQVRLV